MSSMPPLKQGFLPRAYGAVVGNRLVQARQLQQALRHPHGLTQRQVEQAFDAQTELNGFVAKARPRLPVAWPFQFIAGSSQISNEPRAFSAALYAFQFVVRYFRGAGCIYLGYSGSGANSGC